jgi:putative SOS response-associated peptidase YedK
MELASDVFCFTMADDSIFAFAGIWEEWKNPEGQLVETCSIITTTPNALCADVHDRMPAILPDDAYGLWLDPRLPEDGRRVRHVEAVQPGLDAAVRGQQPGESGEER